MTRVRVIALGGDLRGDDEAALHVARQLGAQFGRAAIELVLAGRPGPGLVDLLDTDAPVLLLDVVRSGASAGTLLERRIEDLPQISLTGEPLSSHGFGPAEALALARALGRELPRGVFLGIEGERFELGGGLSPGVAERMVDFLAAARAAVMRLQEQEQCTSQG